MPGRYDRAAWLFSWMGEVPDGKSPALGVFRQLLYMPKTSKRQSVLLSIE